MDLNVPACDDAAGRVTAGGLQLERVFASAWLTEIVYVDPVGGVPSTVASPNKVACVPDSTTVVASRHLIFTLAEGSTSAHSPLTPLLSLWAVASAMNRA